MTAAQLENYIERIPFGGCWIWMKHLRNGYGSAWHIGSQEYAHRISYWLFRGHIPVDKLVLHTCDNKCCINPNHLYLGSHIDNSVDYWSRVGKHYNSEKTSCKHGHELSGNNLIIDKRGDRLCRECNRIRSAEWRRGKQ